VHIGLKTSWIVMTKLVRQSVRAHRLPPSKTPASSAQPAIAASDALAQPQEGHAQANAAGVRPQGNDSHAFGIVRIPIVFPQEKA
jgi:hypothetical protein